MDGSRTTDENWKTLRRIVAMLLALADLAERAGHRSHVVRCLVLWLMRPAEAVARDYLADLTNNRAGHLEPLVMSVTDNSVTGAHRLAASFRTLAAALAAFAIEMFASWQPIIAALCVSLAAAGPLVPLRHPAAAIERRDSS
jgi:hypothetical protein